MNTIGVPSILMNLKKLMGQGACDLLNSTPLWQSMPQFTTNSQPDTCSSGLSPALKQEEFANLNITLIRAV
jgi:hypothetical protein